MVFSLLLHRSHPLSLYELRKEQSIPFTSVIERVRAER